MLQHDTPQTLLPATECRLRIRGRDADDQTMADLHAAWPILLPLAFAMVTCVLGTITRHQMHQRASHDLIRQTKQKRSEYIASVHSRMAATTPGSKKGLAA